jgi:hypothetical protein
MQLNTPPPGANNTPDLLPAVLRSASPASQKAAASTAVGAGDALELMLNRSSRWDSVRTPVTWTVTTASWVLIALDLLTIFIVRAFSGDSDVFGRIITWNHHPAAVAVTAVIATGAMAYTAFVTDGLRRANLTELRVWVGGAICSLVAIASMAVALLLFLLMIAVGIAIGAVLLFCLLAMADL